MVSSKIRTGDCGPRTARQLVGKVVVGRYPAANYRGVLLRYETRRLLVEGVTVLAEKPLDPETLKLDPHLRRSNVRVTGRDLDKGAERSFYLGAFAWWQVLDYESVAAELFPDLRAEVDTGEMTLQFAVMDMRAEITSLRMEKGQRVLPLPSISSTPQAVA